MKSIATRIYSFLDISWYAMPITGASPRVGRTIAGPRRVRKKC